MQAKIYRTFVLKLLTLCMAMYFITAQGVFAYGAEFTSDFVSFSKYRLVEGETIELSVSFLNEYEDNASGSVVFYNNEEILESMSFEVVSGERFVFTTPWEVSFGQHSFVAEIKNLESSSQDTSFLNLKTKPRDISLGLADSRFFNFVKEKGKIGAFLADTSLFLNSYSQTTLSRIEILRLSLLGRAEIAYEKIETKHANQESGGLKFVMFIHKSFLAISLFFLGKEYIFLLTFLAVFLFVLIRIFRVSRKFVKKDSFEK